MITGYSDPHSFPFHVSLEGCDDRVLCREREDYDVFLKIICVCCMKFGADLVMYAIVSNHAHFVILVIDSATADRIASEVKRRYSMYFCRKYEDHAVMRGLDAKALLIDSKWYLRNAIAYDIRNAVDNGADSVNSYEWTGLRGLFCQNQTGGRNVSDLSKRASEQIMHTNEKLSRVRWQLDEEDHLIPRSILNWRYAEAAFNNDQPYLLRMVGCVNVGEMEQKLVVGPRKILKDEELLRMASDISKHWFNEEIHNVPIGKKMRLVSYISHVQKTTPSQLARIFELHREDVEKALR